MSNVEARSPSGYEDSDARCSNFLKFTLGTCTQAYLRLHDVQVSLCLRRAFLQSSAGVLRVGLSSELILQKQVGSCQIMVPSWEP